MTYICKCSDDVDNVDVVKGNEGDDEVQFVKVEWKIAGIVRRK
jgi:hypothetical protein